MNRLSFVNQNLVSAPKSRNFSEVGKKSADDVVVVSALRTPLTRAGKGPLKDTPPEVLFATVLKAVIAQSGIDPKWIEDCQVGNVLMPGSGAMMFRAAQILAGLPIKVPVASTNRLCSSGLEAAALIASKIKAGIISAGIAGGAESMSMYDMNDQVDVEKVSKEVFDSDEASNVMIPMGQCSEILTEKFGLKRRGLDEFAAESHRKAAAARKEGLFKAEIVPITVTVKQPDGTEKRVTVTEDDGIREGTTADSLAKLKPAFRPEGGSTAGNSSQTTDGAAAVLLCSRRLAEQLGLKIIGKFITHAVIGVPPDMMGIGPAEAIPLALQNANLKVSDIDIFEVNEAFASQCSYSVDVLGIDRKKVNPKGGAIAIGHPLGCTGARQLATLFTELHRTKKRLGVTSMCIGSGQGAAAVFEAEF